MTKTELIRSFQPRIQDANIIRDLLYRPQQHIESRTVQHIKEAERAAWESAVLDDLSEMLRLCTGDGANAVSRTRQLRTTANMIAAANAAAERFPERADDIRRISLRCSAHYIQFIADGGAGMITAHFGIPYYVETVETLVDGPSVWEDAFPGEPIPTAEEIAKEMI